MTVKRRKDEWIVGSCRSPESLDQGSHSSCLCELPNPHTLPQGGVGTPLISEPRSTRPALPGARLQQRKARSPALPLPLCPQLSGVRAGLPPRTALPALTVGTVVGRR